MPVELHTRLKQDTYYLGDFNSNAVLLMRNALFPWFIIVPDSAETEIHRLTENEQVKVLQQISAVSLFIENRFNVDKLNVAAIGNIVPQLHIHIIGRRKNDACWPGVVWGTDKFKNYEPDTVLNIRQQLASSLGSNFQISTEID